MPKTRIRCLILNSRDVFENQLYFMVKKSNFGAFFEDTFYLCGIPPNHLRLRSQACSSFILRHCPSELVNK